MNLVKFPGLNLEFNVQQIAFNIFGIDVYMYALIIVTGIVVSYFIATKSKEKFDNNIDDILEVGIISLIVGIIGARLYYVLFNLEYYIESPLRILNLRDGGLGIYGGIILGLITAYIVCKKKKMDVINVFDFVIPYLALSQSIGRWGNFFNVEAYGSVTDSILRMGINTVNGYMEVHPTFLYESVCTLIIFFILRNIQKNRKFKGEVFILYLMSYSFIRFFIEGLRQDSLMIFNFRISQILSLLIFVISLIILIFKFKNIKKEDKIN